MITREVLPDQWVGFFHTFTDKHAGQLVSIRIDGKYSKHQIEGMEARKLPLREIAADLKAKENTVVISVGMSRSSLLWHAIEAVSHVRVVQAEDDSESALEIASMNGQTTILSLSAPPSPSL